MSYTTYKGNEYRFSENFIYNGKFVSGICTENIKKIDDSFVFRQKSNIYLKFLDEAELSDLYFISFSAEYNTEIEDLRKEWFFSGCDIDFDRKRIRLVKTGGDHPSGWTVEEKLVYSKWVDLSELSNFKIVYTYYKKDGNRYNNSPLDEKRKIEYTDDDELLIKILDVIEYYNQI